MREQQFMDQAAAEKQQGGQGGLKNRQGQAFEMSKWNNESAPV